jgi:hypothetical protein
MENQGNLFPTIGEIATQTDEIEVKPEGEERQR